MSPVQRPNRLFLLIAAILLIAPLYGQQTLRVGVALFPPSVVEAEDGRLEGFDIELWQAIAQNAGLQYSFELLPLSDLLTAVEEDRVDLALSGISVTSAREERMDFSHPYMTAGIRILTKADDSPKLLRYAQSAWGSGAGRALAFLVGFILICAHVFYIAERGSKSVSRSYLPGIFESAWFVVATMTTVGYGDLTPHRWLGRFVAFVVMITGIGLFGILVADLSTAMTLEQLQARISVPSDLAERTVVTVRGSTSVEVARSYGASVREEDSIESAIAVLDGGDVDAVVFDSPPLLHYLQMHPDDSAVLVNGQLTAENYAIAVPTASPLLETVNRSLLTLEETGQRDRLYTKWFGVNP
ncbi:MAG: transporter substrate-binding domain-containing protein [Acidobacteria bacterium]|nr:transporter substrate-binding domain-containing protein [Acidobacteriota bacterium]MDA1234849.1 transporter substrate-binding domain-containing protein [Acidobacteriota bacterium]